MFDASSLDLSDGQANSARAFGTSDSELQRVNGLGRLVVDGGENGSRIVELFQSFPVRVLFPRSDHKGARTAVLLNTAGGVAGGDRTEFSVTTLSGASLSVTTQAAEKIYGALAETSRITTRLNVAGNSRLAWLPQETIVFNRARLSRLTEVNLRTGAELLALEWLVLGRAASGEEILEGQIVDAWRVRLDGRLVWADCFRAMDDTIVQLHRKALLAGARAFGTLVYFGPLLDRWLAALRDFIASLTCQCAATSIAGLLIVRLAAPESSALRGDLKRILDGLNGEFPTESFQVPKQWSC